MMASMPFGHTKDPMDSSLEETPCHCRTDLPAYCKRLEETGRGASVPIIKKRHPEMF